MRKLTALILVLVLLLCSFAEVFAANTTKAADMKLDSTSGTVTVKKSSGASVTVRDKMKLYSGYTIKTGKASYAYISLDSSKVIKMDASSEVEIRTSGKKLEVYLKTGELFFDVTEKLKGDESLNIRTNTMVTGIRGTFGSQTPERLVIYKGEAVVTPVMKGNSGLVVDEAKSYIVKAGQMAVSTGNGEMVVSGDVEVIDLTFGDVSAFALSTVGEKQERKDAFQEMFFQDAEEGALDSAISNANEELKLRDEEAKKEPEKKLGNEKWFTEDTGKTPNDGQLIATAGKDNGTVFNQPMTPPAEYVATTYTIRLPQNISYVNGNAITTQAVVFYADTNHNQIPNNTITVSPGETVEFYLDTTGGGVSNYMLSGIPGNPNPLPTDVGDYYSFVPTGNTTITATMTITDAEMDDALPGILSDSNVTEVTLTTTPAAPQTYTISDATISSGKTLNIDATTSITGTLTNNGAINIEATTTVLGSLVNEANATLTMSFQRELYIGRESGDVLEAHLVNHGTIDNSANAYITVYSANGATFTNDGTVTDLTGIQYQ